MSPYDYRSWQPFEKVGFPNLEINEFDPDTLQIVERATGDLKHLLIRYIFLSVGFSAYTSLLSYYTKQSATAGAMKWFARKTGAPAAWHECAVLQNSLTAPYFALPKAGNLIPISAVTLGDVLNFWASAWVESLQIKNDIDLNASTSPIIYWKHNGAGQTAQIEYDKINDRYLFKCADGAAVIGYIDNTGFHNGAP